MICQRAKELQVIKVGSLKIGNFLPLEEQKITLNMLYRLEWHMILSTLPAVDVTIKALCLMMSIKKHGAPAVSKTLKHGGERQVLVAKK